MFRLTIIKAFILLLIVIALYLYVTTRRERERARLTIASPLPKSLTATFYSLTQSHNYWKARTQLYDKNIKKPNISAHAALVYDLSSDNLLFEKDAARRLPIASLTKIMTAIVALENFPIDRQISITGKAAAVGEDSMGLSAGEKLSLKELLYGLFLHSGNDAAEAIAQESTFGRDNFVYLMNKKAESLGLSNTHFTNPTGLEGDGKQYSTAADILVMTRYGLQNADFREIAATEQHDISYTKGHKAYELYNETNLLTTYPGVKGVKTGYTDEAGMCLVTYLEYEGHKLIAVLLNSKNRRDEMKQLLDYSLRTLGVTPPVHS